MTAKEDEEAWKAMRRNFNDKDIITLTAIVGFTNCSNRVAEALHLLPEPPGERIAFRPAEMAGPGR